jgi:hypothetical protein
MRETMLMWSFIGKGTHVEGDYTQLERLRKPADDHGSFHDIDRKI